MKQPTDIFTDCAHAFNAEKKTAVLAESGIRVPVLMPVVAKCYGERPVYVFFRMSSGDNRTIIGTHGVQQQGDHTGPARRKNNESPRGQQYLGKLVNRIRHAVHTGALDQLPETSSPPAAHNRPGGQESLIHSTFDAF